MEYVKGVPYSNATPTPTLPPGNTGYTSTVSIQSLQPDGNLQKILITISLNGKIIYTLDGYKVNDKTP
jgi:hypothetical protein